MGGAAAIGDFFVLGPDAERGSWFAALFKPCDQFVTAFDRGRVKLVARHKISSCFNHTVWEATWSKLVTGLTACVNWPSVDR